MLSAESDAISALKHGVESKAGHRISRCSHPAAGSSSNVPHSTCHGAGSGGLQAGAWSPLVLVPQYCIILHCKTETAVVKPDKDQTMN